MNRITRRFMFTIARKHPIKAIRLLREWRKWRRAQNVTEE